MSSDDPTRPGADPIEDLVERFYALRDSDPDLDIESFLAAHPRHAEELAWVLTEMEADARREEATRPELGAGENQPANLGPWQCLERIASGGGGTVYRARHRQDGFLVALKVLERGRVLDRRDFDRFQREARVLRELDLVNVAPVLDTGESEGALWIAFRWIEGQTLARLAQEIPARDHAMHPFTERARLLARVARVFAAVHDAGVLHRDIKPSNLMVDRLGEPMLIDFGIARVPAEYDLTRTMDATMGTPRYLAPEALEGGNRSLSVRSEVYGLGLCLYELVVGVRPFEEAEGPELFGWIAAGRLKPPRVVAKQVPHALASIILRATHRDPRLRHPDMHALAQDLEAFALGRRLAPATRVFGGALGRVAEVGLRRPVLVLGLLVALVGGGIYGTHEVRELQRIESVAPLLLEQSLMPLELFPRRDPAVRKAIAELVGALPDRPDLRFAAAWALHLDGEHELALQHLGPREGDEPASHPLLRAWLTLLLERTHVGEGGKELPLHTGSGIPLEVDEGGLEHRPDFYWTKSYEDMRKRLLALRWGEAQDFLDRPELRGLAGPDCERLRLALLYRSLPTLLGDVEDEVRSFARRLEALPERDDVRWAWRRAVVAQLLGEHEAALAAVRTVLQQRPDGLPAYHLEALCLQAVEAEPQMIWDALQAAMRHAKPSRVPGGSAVEDKCLRALIGMVVTQGLRLGHLDEVEATLEQARSWIPDPSDPGAWMSEAVVEVLTARLEARLGELVSARERLAELRARYPGEAGWLAANEEAELIRAAGGSRAEVTRFFADLPAEVVERSPARLEPWLASSQWGLRPFARVARLLVMPMPGQ